jgi:D-glycero-D-manno-heptose 1,7-bisphosphate phosphatase
MKIAVFLERDGVLNNPACAAPPASAAEFRVNREIGEMLDLLKQVGFLLIATTNQPGVSRGDLSRRELDLMHERLQRELPLDDILVCPHEQADNCPCRKPNPGLFQEASFKWHVELDRSYVISDKWQDAEAARQVGCVSLLLNSPNCGTGHHDYVVPDIESAFERIVQIEQKRPLLAEN